MNRRGFLSTLLAVPAAAAAALRAKAAAPARITSRTFSRVIPEIATAGIATAATTSAISRVPRGSRASLLDVVGKIAPTPM